MGVLLAKFFGWFVRNPLTTVLLLSVVGASAWGLWQRHELGKAKENIAQIQQKLINEKAKAIVSKGNMQALQEAIKERNNVVKKSVKKFSQKAKKANDDALSILNRKNQPYGTGADEMNKWLENIQ